MSGNYNLGYMNSYYNPQNQGYKFLGHQQGNYTNGFGNYNIADYIPKYDADAKLSNFSYTPMNIFAGSTSYFPAQTSFTAQGSQNPDTNGNPNDIQAQIAAVEKEQLERIAKSRELNAQRVQAAKESVLFKGLGITKKEESVLLEEYSNSLEMDYKLMSGVGLGLGAGAVMYNGGIVSHGINTCKTIGKNSDTNKMFKGNSEAFRKAYKGPKGKSADAKRVTAIKGLWKDNDNLVQEAYYQMHKAERRSHSMLGANKKRYSKEFYEHIAKDMDKALVKAAQGDNRDLAKVTAALKEVNGVNNGWFHRGSKWLVGRSSTLKDPETIYKTLRSGKIPKTEEFKALRSTFASNIKAIRAPKTTFKTTFKAGGGKMSFVMGLAMFGLQVPNIVKAYKSNKKDGNKQLLQSIGKCLLPTIVSTFGEIGGRMLGAKIGAVIGSAFPVVGTILGAGLGMLIGSLAFNATAMTAQKIGGKDVVNDVKTKELAKSENGAEEILQTLMTQAQNGEIKNEETLNILQRLQATA